MCSLDRVSEDESDVDDYFDVNSDVQFVFDVSGTEVSLMLHEYVEERDASESVIVM